MAPQKDPTTKHPAQTQPLATDQESKSRHSITIAKPRDQVYEFFRNFSNLPFFMKGLTQVKTLSPTLTHWEVTLKSGNKTEWDAIITQDEPGHRIAWVSVEGSEVSTQGNISFENAPFDRGCIVRLSMDYSVPGKKLTEFITFFMGESPEILIQTNLKRLKAYLETGECPTTEGQSSGREEDNSSTPSRFTH